MAVTEVVETGQYLTFMLDGEMFSLDISKVREVLEFNSITKVPRMPEYIRGVINLRGSVVPVVDLRSKFGMEMIEKTINSCVIIVEVDLNGGSATSESVSASSASSASSSATGNGKMVLGALVDAVQEVMEIEASDIEPAPNIGRNLNSEFIRGMGKHGERFIIILDIDKVFSTEDIINMGQAPDVPHPQAEPGPQPRPAASGGVSGSKKHASVNTASQAEAAHSQV